MNVLDQVWHRRPQTPQVVSLSSLNTNALLNGQHLPQRSKSMPAKVFFGIHFYSPGREGPAAGIAKADEFQLILRRDNGDDLIFVSHQYHERREHIGGRVWAGRLIR
jgi:hypothetical protein